MKRYEAYKDSGVDWIGEIPEGWEVVRFKRLFKEKRKITDASLNSGSISFGEVVYKDDEKITEATKLSYQVLNEGEFLLNPLNMNYDLKSLRIGLSTINVVVSSGYIILQSKKELNKNYYRWLLRMYDIVFMKTLGAGVRQTINYNDLADSHLLVPSFDEQEAIAEFLDDKTAKIDQTIGIRQKEIELLKERRQILIQKAVTKGLDDTVKFKNSGVDWIGEIPEHWEVRKFKFLCHITTGSKNTENKIDNGLYPFYVRSQTPERINSYTFDGEAILTAGDGAGVGKVFHYVNEKFDFHQRVYKFSRFRDVTGKFLYYYLKNNFYNVALNGEAKSTVDSLRLPLIQNFPVSFPKIDEQTQIVSYLEEIEEKIAKAITLKEQEIEKLKEYKTVLIDQVVTGKVKIN